MIRLSLLFVVFISSVGGSLHEWSSISEEDFPQLVGFNVHVLVNFFIPTCIHCKRLEPTWTKLAKNFNVDRGKLFISSVDCSQSRKLCSHEAISGYPTIKLYKAGSTHGVEYEGSRDLKSITDYLAMQLDGEIDEELERLEDTEPGISIPLSEGGLITLDDKTIDSAIERANGHIFIMFHVNWCSHCQKLAPVYAQLANSLQFDRRVRIAQIDCTGNERSCKQYGVSSYPTLYYFVDGHLVEKYKGSRNLDELKAFVTRMKSDNPTTPEGLAADGDEEVEYSSEEEFQSSHMISEDELMRAIQKLMSRKTSVKMKSVQELKDWQDIIDEELTKLSKLGLGLPEEDQDLNELYPRDEMYITLTDSSFDRITREGFSFVAFVTPWCERSKRLLPLWKRLAVKVLGIDSYPTTRPKVAIVNCSDYEKLCDRQSVDGYPTLLMYSDGKILGEYESSAPKELDLLYDWARSKIPITSSSSPDKDEL